VKVLVIAVLLCSPLYAVAAQGQERDSWLGQDKLKHFFVAGYSYTVSFAGLQAAGASRKQQQSGAAGFSIAVSVGKEVLDRRRGSRFSYRDLAWDGAGIILASVLMNNVRR
jgi:uncharacterized protein YfiM (DUF2279 family)